MNNVQRTGTAPPIVSSTYIHVRYNPKDRRTFIGGSDARKDGCALGY